MLLPTKPEDHQRDAEPLRKILAGEQVGAGANQAAMDLPSADRAVGHFDLLLAVRAGEARLTRPRAGHGRFAGRRDSCT